MPTVSVPLGVALLARMGTLLELKARPPRSHLLNDLKDLQMAPEVLLKNLTAARNRAKNLTLPILKRQNAEQLKQIVRQVSAVEKEIMTRIKAAPVLARRYEILVLMPGLATITALAMIIDMPELGTLENGQAASLAGLAPATRQSSRRTGRAFIRGGRASLRQAVYMPALVAIRFNPQLKAKYDHFIAAGQPAKKAITAIMRKLIILLNALIMDNRKWAPALS